MAILKLKDAVVDKAFSGGKGYAVLEKFTKRDGDEGSIPYTIWFDQPTELVEGTVLSVSGLYSDKIEDYEKKDGSPGHAIRRSINSAKIDGTVSAPVEESPF